ncbi:MAG: aldehyde dehydrogenase (NADP(+)) [Planctomycetes bacterium]|nr:aldehyde dehydrogenase (NADP(+)) [Planctomycetota bacterium]
MPATTFHAFSPALNRPLPQAHRAATPDEVDSACLLAAEAFAPFMERSREDRAALLESIAANIAALGDSLLNTASEETGLSVPRLGSERDRTVFTLRHFAAIVRDGSWARPCIDPGDPNRKPLPKPDLRRMLRPLGPVAVFGASNFPLAYSTAGGDTASALAAACPVVVKGHPSHPATGAAVAQAVGQAVESARFHHGVFSYLQAGGDRELAIGEEVVLHPAIQAVGFTGSFRGGTGLAALAASRPRPIPVFAEMGSINPIFVMSRALARDAEAIAEKVFASITNSTGQMCTCPGLVFLPQGQNAQRFADRLAALVRSSSPQNMLGERIRRSFLSRMREVSELPGVDQLARSDGPSGEGLTQATTVLQTSLNTFNTFPTLMDECFGPSTILVLCPSENDFPAAAERCPGSLAAAIFCDDGDIALGLAEVLARRAGRVVFNGVTTGVEVSPAMVHGGPWPSTNQPHTTAVGAMAIERWCRPVCYQNAPIDLLPRELR